MEHGLVIHRVMKEISCDCSFPTFSKINYYDWALQHHVHVNHPVVVVGFGQRRKAAATADLLPYPVDHDPTLHHAAVVAKHSHIVAAALGCVIAAPGHLRCAAAVRLIMDAP